MAELRIVTLTGADAVLGETVVERVASGLRGELLRPDGPVHDEARKVWNGLINKHPALIARCAGEERKVRLSRIAAVGSGARPEASRSTVRKSWTIASKTPAASPSSSVGRRPPTAGGRGAACARKRLRARSSAGRCPFFVGDIARVGLPVVRHALMLPLPSTKGS